MRDQYSDRSSGTCFADSIYRILKNKGKRFSREALTHIIYDTGATLNENMIVLQAYLSKRGFWVERYKTNTRLKGHRYLLRIVILRRMGGCQIVKTHTEERRDGKELNHAVVCRGRDIIFDTARSRRKKKYDAGDPKEDVLIYKLGTHHKKNSRDVSIGKRPFAGRRLSR